MPMLRSARTAPFWKGTTAKMRSTGKKAMTGASQWMGLSATAGTMLSLSITLTASATGWSKPKGPVRLGPRRDCMRPMPRRSM